MAKKTFNAKEIELLRNLSARRIPMEHIAHEFGMSKPTLERRLKKNKALRDAVQDGRSKGSIRAIGTLFEMAVGREAKTFEDKNGNAIVVAPAVQPDFPALRFWLETQEGFARTEKLEINGALDISSLSDEEVEKRTAKMIARIASRTHAQRQDD